MPRYHGSSIVIALEDFWDALRADHSTLPHVTISLGFVKRTNGYSFGDHVVLSFDAVKGGADVLAATLIHEAVHQSLKVGGARDWHAHQGTFRKAADHFGLIPAERPYGDAGMTAETVDRYAKHIAAISGSLEKAA